jgi:glycine oxidase
MRPQNFDVIVIGGGIIGASVTERLTRGRLKVSLVEAKEHLGLGATAAAIGGITPQSDESCLGPLGRAAELSRARYQPWVDALGQESGNKIDVLSTGQIQVALQEEELSRLDTVIAPAWEARGFDILRMSPQELRSHEPLLSENVLGGYLLRSEFALEPRRLMNALELVLEKRPLATVKCGSAVAALDVNETACTVVLTDETVLSSRYIVLATGRSAEDFVDIPKGILFPVKGQAIELVAPGFSDYPLTYHCYAKIRDSSGVRSSYFVPRKDGRLVAGITYEVGHSDTLPTRAAYEQIMRGIGDLLPTVASWPQTMHWAGVRPGIIDGIPIIGPNREYPNLIYCVGHYGLGVTLAPISAEMVAILVGEEAAPAEREQLAEALRTCSPQRFLTDRELR